jgi:hypothetical protein
MFNNYFKLLSLAIKSLNLTTTFDHYFKSLGLTKFIKFNHYFKSLSLAIRFSHYV